jgi:CheY-like chemotaxis protein
LHLLEKLWSNLETASIPVVMITANIKSEIVQRGLSFGVMDCLTKPIQPRQVAEKVRQWVDCLGTSVLVVDDDVSIRALLENRFRPTGCRVLLADEGSRALEIMKNSQPDWSSWIAKCLEEMACPFSKKCARNRCLPPSRYSSDGV